MVVLWAEMDLVSFHWPSRGLPELVLGSILEFSSTGLGNWRMWTDFLNLILPKEFSSESAVNFNFLCWAPLVLTNLFTSSSLTAFLNSKISFVGLVILELLLRPQTSFFGSFFVLLLSTILVLSFP